MDLHRYPDLIDRLASEYALGVLRGAARRRLERLAERDPVLSRSITVWQARLGALAELAPAVEPPATAWNALERRLGLSDLSGSSAVSSAGAASDAAARARIDETGQRAAERRESGAATASGAAQPRAAASPAVRPAPRWFESLAFWRGWSIGATGFALAAAIALAVTLRPFAPAPSPGNVTSVAADRGAGGTPVIERVSYVAALADVNTKKTMVFVMWDDKSAMLSAHRMSGGDAPPPGRSEQLWGIPEHGQPVSLGMLPPGKIVHMKVRGMNSFVRLAVSVEPPGGSASENGPSGPVVCAGKLMATA
jgi:anti-sigma-K factor RskA